MQTCDLENWKEALAMALTYAKADEFTKLCGNVSLLLHVLIPMGKMLGCKIILNYILSGYVTCMLGLGGVKRYTD